jgi:O-antigen ligase
MKRSYSFAGSAPEQSNAVISRTWFFRFASLAFIAMATPALAVYMRGLAGFFIILVLAILAGLIESSFNQIMRAIAKGISQNKMLFVFVIWYTVGFVLNIFSRGEGLADWRYMLTPILILLGLFYGFAFMGDKPCHRYFQISFIIVSGIQTFFSARVLTNTVGIARAMWYETSGTWVYGNQLFFAMYAAVLPVLLWRSFREAGILRLLLLLSCLFILFTSSISAFATPLSLIILSAPIILTLSLYLFKRKSRKLVMLLAVIIPIIFLLGYRYSHNNPLFYQAYSRIDTFVQDPRSGGYNTFGAVSRWDLANISIKTFRAEPLFGMGGPRAYNPFIGGHSSFFDSLAIYGLLGGGAAICGIILVILTNAMQRFWRERDWETLFALTVVVLLTVVGIANPYWEGILPLVLIIAHPFKIDGYQQRKVKYPMDAYSSWHSL